MEESTENNDDIQPDGGDEERIRPHDEAVAPGVPWPEPDEELASALDQISADPNFVEGLARLDVEGLAREFNTFSENISAYNRFHTRERRLWSLKLGTGEVQPRLEAGLQEAAPAAMQSFLGAFTAIANCMTLVESAGLDAALNTHISTFTRLGIESESNPFGQTLSSYFRLVGCAPAMLEEFRDQYRDINYDFVGALGQGEFANLRGVMQEGVEAQVSILEYTRDNGLSYLQAECGPPAWAVQVSNILQSAGISISAWVVVAIIATLVVLLGYLCTTRRLPSSVCRLLVGLGIITIPLFTF